MDKGLKMTFSKNILMDKKSTIKTFLFMNLLFLLFGCSSDKSFIKNNIIYNSKELYEHIKEKQLLSVIEGIRYSKCKELAKEKLKKDNLSQAREIRKLYPDFIPTGFMANGVNTSSGEFASSAEDAAEYALAGADLAIAAQNTKAGMVSIAMAGGIELYRMYKNSPILNDPKVQRIIKNYDLLYEDTINKYIGTCTMKVADIDIGEYEQEQHLFGEDTIEREIELDFSINGEEDDISWSQQKQ